MHWRADVFFYNVVEPVFSSEHRTLTNILMTIFFTFVDLLQFIITISKCLSNGVIVDLTQIILSGKLIS